MSVGQRKLRLCMQEVKETKTRQQPYLPMHIDNTVSLRCLQRSHPLPALPAPHPTATPPRPALPHPTPTAKTTATTHTPHNPRPLHPHPLHPRPLHPPGSRHTMRFHSGDPRSDMAAALASAGFHSTASGKPRLRTS